MRARRSLSVSYVISHQFTRIASKATLLDSTRMLKCHRNPVVSRSELEGRLFRKHQVTMEHQAKGTMLEGRWR